METIPLRLLALPFIRKYNVGGKRFQTWFMNNLSWGSYKKLTGVVDVMHRTSLEIFDIGKQALEADGEDGSRKDILTTLSKFTLDPFFTSTHKGHNSASE